MSAEPEPFKLKANRAMLYSDLLGFILRKILPNDAEPLLKQLKLVSNDRWTAVENGDEEAMEKLRIEEDDLVDRLIVLGTAKS